MNTDRLVGWSYAQFGWYITSPENQWHIAAQHEPHREKTGFLPMRKQRRRSASR